MSIYQFSNYKTFLRHWLHSKPQRGHGELKKIADALQVHPTLLSLVFSDQRDFSIEQAFDLGQYLQLTELESEYLLLLVQAARAGNSRIRQHFQTKIQSIKEDSQKIEKRIQHERKLSQEEQMRYYSSWIYSAIRLYCSTHPSGRTLDEIAERYSLGRPRTVDALEFLLSTGLVTQAKDRYKMGLRFIYLGQDSHSLPRHHTNWRVKAVQKSDHISSEEMMFTFPCSLSRQDFATIREELTHLLQNISQRVKESPAEEVACLNIDFFWLEK